MSDEQRDGAMSDGATDETLRALAEPRRRAILRLVARDELAAGEIAAAFEVTRTAVSQHLTVLRNAGLLAERRGPPRRVARPRPAGLAGRRRFPAGRRAPPRDPPPRLLRAGGRVAGDQQART